MSIKFLPDQMLKKIAPARKIKKILSGRVTVKKTALRFLDDAEFEGGQIKLDKSSVVDVALKVAKNYQDRIDEADDDGELKASLQAEPALLINRVQNEIVFQVHEQIKSVYRGQRARWLPSAADEPRPNHGLGYGMEYTIGEGLPLGENGEMIEPGDEYGCQCGVEILTNDDELNLT